MVESIMSCDKCENQVVYSRKYSGEKLCSNCFSESIVRKAAKTISKYKMIKNDDLVCVAVSGGWRQRWVNAGMGVKVRRVRSER